MPPLSASAKNLDARSQRVGFHRSKLSAYHEVMKAKPEYVEGTEAWTRFQGAMKKVIAVPHAEIQRRIEAERSEAAKNPNRRGPKPKSK